MKFNRISDASFDDLEHECDTIDRLIPDLNPDQDADQCDRVQERLMAICHYARTCYYMALAFDEGERAANPSYKDIAAALYAKAQGVMKAHCLDDDPDDYPQNYPPL